MTIDEAIQTLNIQKEYIKTAMERPSVFFGGTVNQKDDFRKLLEALEMAITAIIEYRDKLIAPCDVCRYNPPSSFGGKPCTICPADAIPD